MRGMEVGCRRHDASQGYLQLVVELNNEFFQNVFLRSPQSKDTLVLAPAFNSRVGELNFVSLAAFFMGMTVPDGKAFRRLR
jgi:hypothetical protein